MCVTSGPAVITDTKTFAVAKKPNGGAHRHIVGYQNKSRSNGPTCMFLHYQGSDLQMVNGPELTTSLMDDMTWRLPELVYVPRMRGGGTLSGDFPTRGITVVDYGDYTNVIAHSTGDMLPALTLVRPDRRPVVTRELREMIDFYMSWAPNASFVLACFNGDTQPKHPIVVSYVPNDPDVLTIPGLDGHDGKVPVPGSPVYHGFAVAFAIEGEELPHVVHYDDNVAGRVWAPRTVAGFVDNRPESPNVDYVVTLDAVRSGLTGRELAAALR